MGNKNEKEEQEKTFVVRDKRFSAQKEGEGDSQVQGETKREGPHAHEEFSEQATSLPEISFTNFLLSLSTSAFIQLGEVEDPITQQTDKNLPLAKQTIDLIGMLREKTKGNLTSEEEKLMEHLLYDLKMRYVRATG